MDFVKEKHKIFMHIFISWLIFSIFYIICAYQKPFHVDEFYSWVYPERCSWGEIITLKKEFGIGHPPLYHLLQKMVQTVFQPYHFLHVRLVNYFIGSLFIVLFVGYILKQKYIPYFCYGLAGSATILEIFVFSRMWGLICLSSFLLIWSVEEYYQNHKRRYFIIFIGSCLFGFLSDYSFILLSLYFVFILFKPKSYLIYIVYLYFTVLLISKLIFLSRSAIVKEANIGLVLYDQIRGLGYIILKTINVLFNFWFVELILISGLIFGLLALSEIFGRNNFNKYSLNFPFNYISFLLSFFKSKLKHIFDLSHDYNRVLLTVIGAWLIIWTVNDIFWTGIIRKRFLTILCPFLILMIIRYFHKKALNILAVVLLCSGLIFASSNRVAGIYPPPSFDRYGPIIYENEWAYATQYLKGPRGLDAIPFIADFSSFYKRCRLCRMGTNNFQLDKYSQIWVVCSNRANPEKFIPAGFRMAHEGLPNFTWLDKLQFNYLTPLPKNKYLVFKYYKIRDYD